MFTRSKYPKLLDRAWLEEQYFKLRRSTCQIAVDVGCTTGAVVIALNRHGFKLRPWKEAAHGRKLKGFRVPELNDPEILRHMYHEENLTTYEIASIFGTNQHSVMCALTQHGIQRRSMSEAAKNRSVITIYYPLLYDTVYLHKQYVIDKKSSSIIASEIGCSVGAVVSALCRLGIPLRSHSEAQKLVPHFSSYDQLNDPEWLKEKYEIAGLSTIKIAEIVGAKSCNSARQALIRNGLEVRNLREGVIFNREEDGFLLNHDVIEGGLLGDAGMGIYCKNSTISMPYHYRKNKFFEHVKWVSSIFYKNPENRMFPESVEKYGTYWRLRTLSHEILLPYFKRWYPEISVYPTKKPFEKIIPDDVCISPESMLHAFLDDGTMYRRIRPFKTYSLQVCIIFCFDGFTKENLEVFRDKANKTFNMDLFRMRKTNQGGYGYRISIRQSKAQDFFSIIGPPPIKCLSYKWRYAHNKNEVAL